MEKEITIYDLADKLQLSAATVSRGLQDHPAISKKTKKRIFDLAEQIGYRSNHFARSLRSNQTFTLGAIVPRLDSYFMSTVIAGMEEAAGTKGYKLIITQSSEQLQKEATNARTLFNSRVDGLLISSLACDTGSLAHLEGYLNKKIPVVFFDRVLPYEACTQILIDNRKAAFEIVQHLVQQGCRRIVHITSPHRQNVYRDRLEGYQQALAAAGIPFREDYVLTGSLGQQDGKAAAAALLQMAPLPDGVFVANDNCAVGCLAALKKAGIRIPEDIAIAGFNNDPVCTVVEPDLTTINYPGYEMGQIAASHLVQQLADAPTASIAQSILLRADLVIRGSSLKQQPF